MNCPETMFARATLLAALCVWFGFLPAPAAERSAHHVWGVVLHTSRFWMNYRHTSDALAVYHLLKAGGVSDQDVGVGINFRH